jgi:hypothetical protein
MKQTYEIRTVKVVEVEWTHTHFGVVHGFVVGTGTTKNDWATVTSRGLSGATLTVYPTRPHAANDFTPRLPVTSLHDSVEDAMKAGGTWLGDRA